MTAVRRTAVALGRGLWRGRKVLIPFGVVAVLLIGTLVMHAIDTPDPDDTDFLSPTSSAPIGSSRLADDLRDQGVTVVPVTDPDAALRAANGSTLFIPAAEFIDPTTTSLIELLPRSTRVVLVDPPARTLNLAGVPLQRDHRRWATAAATPGQCTIEGVEDAGAAATRRQSYAVVPKARGAREFCYGGSVARSDSSVDIVVVGATDPFRNDRLDEHDNRALAAGLLGSRSRLVWLDLHERYERPRPPEASYTPDPDGNQSYDGGDGDDGGQQGSGRDNPGPGGGADSDEGDPGNAAGDRNGVDDVFPPWLWAMLATLGAAILLLILWAGRRLGGAVTEPLPVEVRSGETVLGRGRLYQRAKARGTVAEVLRGDALKRIEPALDLPPGHHRGDVVEAVATRTGSRREIVDALLFGPEPTHDDDLLHLHRDLDALAVQIAGVAPAGRSPQAPHTPPGGAGPDQGEPR